MQKAKLFLSIIIIIVGILLLWYSLPQLTPNKWWTTLLNNDDKNTMNTIRTIRTTFTVVGICMIIFGIFIFLQSFDTVRKKSNELVKIFLKSISK